MHDLEYKVQSIETDEQWRSGLACGLRLNEEGISLFARPAFESWLTPPEWSGDVTDVAIDECGQVYWIARASSTPGVPRPFWNLFVYNPHTGRTERLIGLGTSGEIEPLRLWLGPEILWIFDFLGSRALAFERGNLQILYEIGIPRDFEEIAFDGEDSFYALEPSGEHWQLCRYDAPPAPSKPECVPVFECAKPAAVAVSREVAVFVYCADLGRVIKFDPAGRKFDVVGSQAIAELKNFKTKSKGTPMEIDSRGVIYLASQEQPALHLFDPAGSYLGQARLPKEIKRIIGIGFDRLDKIYLATDRGIAVFSLTLSEIGETGAYYTRTLDNGVQGGQWHRVDLDAHLPPRTSIEVRHHASDDPALKRAVDAALNSGLPAYEVCRRMENLLGPLWNKRAPEVFQSEEDSGVSSATRDMLVTPAAGRYLWLKITLATFDDSNRPSVRGMRVIYPRSSYLRYLPGIYREDEVHAAFLEKFLSLFETVFQGLDRKIDLLFQQFDPLTTPPAFLPWLASWINLTVEEDVPPERVRRLIERAPALYRRKGTPAAIREFLEIYTGRPAFIVEEASQFEPMLLGGETRIGRGSILLRSGLRGFRLGDTSMIGGSALRDRVRDPEEPFLALAGRFIAFVDMAPAEFAALRRTLERVLDEHKPANTVCTLRLISAQAFAGAAVLGSGAAVTEYLPNRVGVTALGAGIAAKGPQGLRVERGAWIGSNAGLV